MELKRFCSKIGFRLVEFPHAGRIAFVQDAIFPRGHSQSKSGIATG